MELWEVLCVGIFCCNKKDVKELKMYRMISSTNGVARDYEKFENCLSRSGLSI